MKNLISNWLQIWFPLVQLMVIIILFILITTRLTVSPKDVLSEVQILKADLTEVHKHIQDLPRLQDRWTATDTLLWSEELRRLNPEIKFPKYTPLIQEKD